MVSQVHPDLLKSLSPTVLQLLGQFDEISSERKKILIELAQFIQKKIDTDQQVYLNFICTHNSRRSQLAQIWAQTASYYYAIPMVNCFSGGTEATAFNSKAVKAMQQAGFNIMKTKDGSNPSYDVKFSNGEIPLMAYSKKYDDPSNPQKDFAAIMTCSHADENCPLVFGAATRIAIAYDDPKDFDGTPQEEAKYNERVMEIGREMFFTFSKVKI